MIPKRIFYVWFGGEKPAMVNICIQNWREKLPDYEIVEINETSPYFNFYDAYKNCLWFKTIYDKKMWAYVADYVRCKVLYDHGGIYFDTDVTVVKSLDNLLNNDFFAGYEKENLINGAIMGCAPKHTFMKDMIDFYHNEIFKSPLYTIPTIMTELIKRNNYKNITIFTREYFYPFYPFVPYKEKFSPQCITQNTYTIHWWNASWIKPEMLFFLENKHKNLQNTHTFKSYRIWKLFGFLPVMKTYQDEKNTKNKKLFCTHCLLFTLIPFLKFIKYDNGYKIKFFNVTFLRQKDTPERKITYLFDFIPLLKIRIR